MRFDHVILPQTLDEAYQALTTTKDSIILSGGAFLKLQNRDLHTVIDLKDLKLDFINELTGMVEIGPMVTLRNFETHQALPDTLKESAKNIAGVAVRNVATIGGSVAGRYPFSDTVTALLALNAHLEFYKNGHMSLEKFLSQPLTEPDILIKIVVPQIDTSLFKAVRQTYADFSIINLAIVKNTDLRIAIGARPMIATVIKSPDINQSPREILKDIDFESDFKASGEYRRVLAQTLLEDAFKEVRKWK